MKSLQSKLETARQKNVDALKRLANEGVGPDPLMMFKERLDHVTEFIYKDLTDEELAEEEMRWEERFGDLLEAAQAQVNQAKLTIMRGSEQLSIADGLDLGLGK